jgi:adenylosuccinate lyase
VLSDENLKSMKAVLSNLVFNEEHIKKNLYLQRESLAEAVMIALTKKGIPRQTAHKLLRDLSGKEDFLTAVQEHPRIQELLTEKEIEVLLTPETYIGESVALVQRIVDQK